MLKILVIATAVVLAGCATQQQGQLAGAAVGAAVGTVIGGELSGGRYYGGGHWTPRPPPPVYHVPPPRIHYNPYAVCDQYMDPYWRNRCIYDIRSGMGRRW